MADLTKLTIDTAAIETTAEKIKAILNGSLDAAEVGKLPLAEAVALNRRIKKLITLPSHELFVIRDLGEGRLMAQPGEALSAILCRGHALGLI